MQKIFTVHCNDSLSSRVSNLDEPTFLQYRGPFCGENFVFKLESCVKLASLNIVRKKDLFCPIFKNIYVRKCNKMIFWQKYNDLPFKFLFKRKIVVRLDCLWFQNNNMFKRRWFLWFFSWAGDYLFIFLRIFHHNHRTYYL